MLIVLSLPMAAHEVATSPIGGLLENATSMSFGPVEPKRAIGVVAKLNAGRSSGPRQMQLGRLFIPRLSGQRMANKTVEIAIIAVIATLDYVLGIPTSGL